MRPASISSQTPWPTSSSAASAASRRRPTSSRPPSGGSEQVRRGRSPGAQCDGESYVEGQLPPPRLDQGQRKAERGGRHLLGVAGRCVFCGLSVLWHSRLLGPGADPSQEDRRASRHPYRRGFTPWGRRQQDDAPAAQREGVHHERRVACPLPGRSSGSSSGRSSRSIPGAEPFWAPCRRIRSARQRRAAPCRQRKGATRRRSLRAPPWAAPRGSSMGTRRRNNVGGAKQGDSAHIKRR